MEIGLRDKILTVVAPIKDSPAFKAGVKAGDRVLKIDGKSTENMSVEAAVKLIRGQRGTTVTINFFREGKKAPFDLKIVRDTINLPTLDSEMRKDGIFVIRLYSFNAQSGRLFNDALKEFAQTKGKKLIIDLRNNPGGYLETAIDIASRFLPEGTTVVSERYRDKPEDIRQAVGGQLFDKSLKTVVLINEGSASASEILAGALRENDAAILVGAKSFGKGSVQELVKLTSDTNLKVTIARWYTPKGNTISEKGIVPDHEVKFDAEAFEKNAKDTQMDKAVQLLLQSK
jgi:carboxyl-terminal processing protease